MSLRRFVPGNKLPAETRPSPLAGRSRRGLSDRRQRIGGLPGPEQTSILRHFLTDEGRLFLNFRNLVSNRVMEIIASIAYRKKLGSNRFMW
jgi:hypothetical protein